MRAENLVIVSSAQTELLLFRFLPVCAVNTSDRAESYRTPGEWSAALAYTEKFS